MVTESPIATSVFQTERRWQVCYLQNNFSHHCSQCPQDFDLSFVKTGSQVQPPLRKVGKATWVLCRQSPEQRQMRKRLEAGDELPRQRYPAKETEPKSISQPCECRTLNARKCSSSLSKKRPLLYLYLIIHHSVYSSIHSV